MTARLAGWRLLRLLIVLAALGGVGAALWWRGPDWGTVGDAFEAVRWWWVVGAIGITVGFGVGREIHDKRMPGNIFSVRDLTWDAIGTAAGTVLLAHTIR